MWIEFAGEASQTVMATLVCSRKELNVFAQQHNISRRRIFKLALVIVALVAATMAIAAPSASAETITQVARICPNGGVVAIDEVADNAVCVRPADATNADGSVSCTAPSKSAADGLVDESQIVGASQIISAGACYYDSSCPTGFDATGIITSGPDAIFTAECVPQSTTSFRRVTKESECVATDTVAAQWFPNYEACYVVITPPVLAAGVSTPRQDCTAAGGYFDSDQCTLPVYRDDLAPEPTTAPPGPQPTGIPIGYGSETVSAPSPSCGTGVKVVDESSDRLWCAVAAGPPVPGAGVSCPAGAKPSTELGVDVANQVGMNDFIEGSCYYEPTCPTGFSLIVSMSAGTTGTVRSASCEPDARLYQRVLTADKCVTTDGTSARWFAASSSCGVPITPAPLADASGLGGPSNAEQNCYAAGGHLIEAGTVCVLPVFSSSLTPQPTATPSATPTTVPTVVPTAVPPTPVPPKPTPVPPKPTPVPPKPTAVPPKPTPVPPKPTAVPPKPTPTPKHPGFGFTG